MGADIVVNSSSPQSDHQLSTCLYALAVKGRAYQSASKEKIVIRRLILVSLLILLSLTACSTQPTVDTSPISAAVQTAVAEMPTQEPVVVEVTRIVEVTREVEVTRQVELVVTATPTATPEATPTPQGYDITASEVLTGLIDAGLPIGEHIAYTAESDPNELLGRPGKYTSKVNFRDTRLPIQTNAQVDIDDGGAIEVFDSAEDALLWSDYNETLSDSLPMLFHYVMVEENVVIRLTKRLLSEQAEEYSAVLRQLLEQ